ncbi:ribonuclease H-like domain-containing protein [Methanocorpusculum sp. MG]|uniref:Ribonuclease H-like domain-containing protein n=1 Tax=Methanocorpusculum petauri TaxID=3002863 RepID=A0ABT4IHL7_9EURY|nr:ribonuclease H-like domain-containing protein [Methanocorpusculum petauri]MCZ0861245.1 ribonuclease H-like domain-containing protein [Methanocorpusculum petauri]MDE2444356.1 ribonuclease H-like domain-containing protein [Methanocorpusculum sp.]
MMQVEQGFVQALSLRTSVVENSVFPEGFEAATADGCCLAIESVHSLPEFFVSEKQLRERLMHELTLVHGIGTERERMCRRRGIQTLTDLRRTNWRSEAQEIAETIQNGTPREVIRLFRERGRGADPLLIGFGAAVPREDLLFFDIETLGMVHSPIILFGCGVCEGGTLRVTQYLLRDIGEEIAALELVAEMMRAHPALVTYNGRSFDLPFTNSRLAYYGERECRPALHFDLLHPARRLFREDLPDCCLGTVEEYVLGCGRKEDLPGYLVPVYYQKYLRTGDVAPLKQIVDHNRSDVTSLALLLARQTEMMYGT